MNLVRKRFSIPVLLNRKMKEHKEVNWSLVVSRAVHLALREKEKAKK